MEILYYLSAICLLSFMVLATYDGFYLHIWKYELFKRKESVFEHKTHTARAILFPLIIWLLFIKSDESSFWIGMFLVTIDLIILGIDALAEGDSRKSLGGLPKWEYVLHLFANSFHFASVLLMVATKTSVSEFGLSIDTTIKSSFGSEMINIIAVNIIPGAIILTFVHLILLQPKGIQIWAFMKNKIHTPK